MAVLHVKSPDGTSYNMTIVTSGVTESLHDQGWCKLPNGLIFQWGNHKPGNEYFVFHIAFPTYVAATLSKPYGASNANYYGSLQFFDSSNKYDHSKSKILVTTNLGFYGDSNTIAYNYPSSSDGQMLFLGF